MRLLPEERRERIRQAHLYFERCQEIRPNSVTGFYRQGMLYKEVEDKTIKAARCFERAVANWEALSDEERRARHQERPDLLEILGLQEQRMSARAQAAAVLDPEKARLLAGESSPWRVERCGGLLPAVAQERPAIL